MRLVYVSYTNNIFGMNLIKYNANTGGNNTGDCVCRAISIAFNISYNEVRKYLNKWKNQLNASTYKIPRVFSNIITDLGGSSAHTVERGITVEQFVDDHMDNNAYIMLVGKNDDGNTSHLVTCRHGNLFDSWDSSEWYVAQYYTVPSSCFGEELELTNIKDYFQEFMDDIIPDNIRKQVALAQDKWFSKYSNYYDGSASISYRDYLIIANVKFEFTLSDNKQKQWVFKIPYTFTPYMNYEDSIEFIKQQTKKKMYEKFYQIHKTIDAYENEYQRTQTLSDDVSDIDTNGLDKDTQKFFNTLPAWVQIRCKDIRVYKGSGIKYYINCSPLPEDKCKDDVQFFSKTLAVIREELDLYKKYKYRANIDYKVGHNRLYDVD